jgi:hypothetical protein
MRTIELSCDDKMLDLWTTRLLGTYFIRMADITTLADPPLVSSIFSKIDWMHTWIQII